jgi:hypothetical protein
MKKKSLLHPRRFPLYSHVTATFDPRLFRSRYPLEIDDMMARFFTFVFFVSFFSCVVSATTTTIVVAPGPYTTPLEAANDEANVGWYDADSADDRACTECFAGLELQTYLRRMTGRPYDFSMVSDSRVPEGDWLILGQPGRNKLLDRVLSGSGVSVSAIEQLGPQGYQILSLNTPNRRITILTSPGRTGCLYAAYDYLHRLGVRWYAPGPVNEEVPQREWSGLPDIQASEQPAIFTRGFHAWENRGDPEFILWMARNRMNYWCVEQEPKSLLHKLGIMLVGGGHVLTHYYLGPQLEYPYANPAHADNSGRPADPYAPSPESQGDSDGDGRLTYFEAHPEWYGLRNGQRSSNIKEDFGDNFCTSNPDAMTEWTRNAVQDLVNGRYKDARFINAWALDVGKWCECDACQALGTPTDRNILLVHHYGKAIEHAQAEGRINRSIRLLFLAYADVVEPPRRPLPPDFNYEICIATFFPINRCYVHDFDDAECGRNRRYFNHLLGWAVSPDRFYRGQLCIGEYYNVSGYKSLPAVYMHTMENDIPVFYDIGARHFHYMHCTTRNWGNKSLTNWQFARQLWNPELDCDALWQDYFQGRYHAASALMRQFYQNLEDMLSNINELKYVLAPRLNNGSDPLFTGSHLGYEPRIHPQADGPDLLQIVQSADRCGLLLDQTRSLELQPRIRSRIEEDRRMFTYGARTVRFYEALSRGFLSIRGQDPMEARNALDDARRWAALLEQDTESTRYSSSHANAPDALEASRAADGLERLRSEIESAE